MQKIVIEKECEESEWGVFIFFPDSCIEAKNLMKSTYDEGCHEEGWEHCSWNGHSSQNYPNDKFFVIGRDIKDKFVDEIVDLLDVKISVVPRTATEEHFYNLYCKDLDV